MKKPLSIILITFFCLLAVVLPAMAAKGKATPESGTIKGSTYANQFFEFNLEIPAGWYVVTSAENEKALEQGKKSFTIEKTGAPAEDAGGTHQLLNVARKKPGISMELNPSCMVVAESLDVLKKRNIVTSGDYLLNIRKSMQQSFFPVTFPRDIYTKSISGIKFDVLEVRIKQGTVNASQVFYAVRRKDHLLIFTLTFSGSSDDRALNTILKSVRFK